MVLPDDMRPQRGRHNLPEILADILARLEHDDEGTALANQTRAVFHLAHYALAAANAVRPEPVPGQPEYLRNAMPARNVADLVSLAPFFSTRRKP